MGKPGKFLGSPWYDIRMRALNPEVIKLAFNEARLIEYVVPTNVLGVDQGTALLTPADVGAKTARGVWVTGAHVSASDPDIEVDTARLKPTAAGLFLYHFCFARGCKAHTQKDAFLSHITKF